MDTNNIKLAFNKRDFKVLMETLKCAATDEARPVLKGVLFKDGDIVALDGYRMKVRYSPTPFVGEFIILAEELKKVVKSISGDTASVELEVNLDKNIYEIKLFDKYLEESNKFEGNLLGGSFPNYKTLLPSEDLVTTEVLIDSKKLLDIIKPLKKNQKCVLEIADELLTVTELEEYKAKVKKSSKTEKINIKEMLTNSIYAAKKRGENKELKIAFDNGYLKDSLSNYKDVTDIKFINNVSPAIVTDSEHKRLDLVLPVRLI